MIADERLEKPDGTLLQAARPTVVLMVAGVDSTRCNQLWC